MPWKVTEIVNERMRFVVRHESGERMTDLCRAYGISRKTGYKIWNRYLELGAEGLFDHPRRPFRQWQKTAPEIEDLIVRLRNEHTTWGAKKLKATLERQHPGLRFPAGSTFSEILSRRGLVVPRIRRRRHLATPTEELTQSVAPNDVWTADFKGQFKLGNGRYCYPLTLCDHFSRYFLGCDGLETTRSYGVRAAFTAAFREYGLPIVIRTDNGAPFASVGMLGLSALSVWWMRLGILCERIEPGHPEQNGRHERLHLTLKRETIRPAASNSLQQQERFDRFREEYNNERPHEALNMQRPKDRYSPSTRRYPEELPELKYPTHDIVRQVRENGWFRFKKEQVYLGKALEGQRVGLRETEPNTWLVTFMQLDLGYLNSQTMKFMPVE